MKILDKIKWSYKQIVHRIGGRNTLYMSLSIIIILFATYYISKMLGMFNREGFDASTDGKKQAELMLFYATWCPACKAFKPTWNDTKQSADQKTINGYHVIFTDVDCSNKDDAATTKKCQQFGVKGYPTVILLKDGTKYEYTGKRTKDGLMEFLNANLA